jgi:hypothetical protein
MAMNTPSHELPVIQKTYDLIVWYVPILNRLPRDHKFALGDRLVAGLYDLLETLLLARYHRQKTAYLESSAAKVNLLRYHTRLLLDFHLIQSKRYAHVARQLESIGADVGGWLKHQQRKGRA